MQGKEPPNLFQTSKQPTAPETVTADGVVVRELVCRSLLNRSGIDDYSFNCYTGCGHGCVYCYARFMQRFHPHREPWGRFVDVKINAVQALQRQLRTLASGSVFTCSACDGWQEVERTYCLSRKCCGTLLEAGFHLNVLTKSDLILRDLDIFSGRQVSLGVTITTLDEQAAAAWEPGASSVAARLRILREAKAAGLKTAVMFGPLLPGLSDSPEALRALFSMAGEVNVDRILTDALNPRPLVWPSVRTLLEQRYPELLPLYRRVLFENAYRATYRDQLHARVRRIAAETGLADRLG